MRLIRVPAHLAATFQLEFSFDLPIVKKISLLCSVSSRHLAWLFQSKIRETEIDPLSERRCRRKSLSKLLFQLLRCQQKNIDL